MWLKEYLRNSGNTRFLKSNGDRRLLILPERITDSTGLSLQKHRQRRQNASIFFDKPVVQHTESDLSEFCPSTMLGCEDIRKEPCALQPLLLGPALQLGRALPRTDGLFPELNPSSTTTFLGSNYFHIPNTPVPEFWWFIGEFEAQATHATREKNFWKFELEQNSTKSPTVRSEAKERPAWKH